MDTLQQPKPEAKTLIDPVPIGDRPSATRIQNISACLLWIKNFFDYLAGALEEPPPGAAFLASPLWIGVWWGLMIGLILLFCGQTSKFIYIDF